MKKHPITALLTVVMFCMTMLGSAVQAAAAEYPYRSSCGYIYHQLSGAAQELYDGLYEASQKVDASSKTYKGISEVYYSGLSQEQMEDIINLFTYDHPEFFWLSNYFHYGYDYSGTYASIDVYSDYQSGSDREAAKEQIYSIAESYISEAAKYTTDYERAKYLAEQLRADVTYQDGSLSQTLASTFLEKATVCAGFTKAYSLLANAVGVETIATLSPSHAWNYSKIAGKWYHVDVTNRLFLYSDSEISSWDKLTGKYTATYSDGTTVSYYMHDISYQYYTKELFPVCADKYNQESEPVSIQYKNGSEETTTTTTTTVTTTTNTTTTTTSTSPTTTTSTTTSTKPTATTSTTTSTKPATTTSTTSSTELTTTTSTTTTKPTTTTSTTTTTKSTTTTSTTSTTSSSTATETTPYTGNDPLPPEGASLRSISVSVSTKSGIPHYYFAEDTGGFDINDFVTASCTLIYSDGTEINLDHYPDAAIYGDDFTVSFSYDSPKALFEAVGASGFLYDTTSLTYEGYALSSKGRRTLWIGQYGDCNLDGTVNAADASYILIYTAQQGLGQSYSFPIPSNCPQEFAQFLTGADSPESIDAACASRLLGYVAQSGLAS